MSNPSPSLPPPPPPSQDYDSPFLDPETMNQDAVTSTSITPEESSDEVVTPDHQAQSSLNLQPQHASSIIDASIQAEPQGVMQMLSLVGSHFLEADRLGLTDGDGDEGETPGSEYRAEGETEGRDLDSRDGIDEVQSAQDEALGKGMEGQRRVEAQDSKGKAIPTSWDHRARPFGDLIDDQG